MTNKYSNGISKDVPTIFDESFSMVSMIDVNCLMSCCSEEVGIYSDCWNHGHSSSSSSLVGGERCLILLCDVCVFVGGLGRLEERDTCREVVF